MRGRCVGEHEASHQSASACTRSASGSPSSGSIGSKVPASAARERLHLAQLGLNRRIAERAPSTGSQTPIGATTTARRPWSPAARPTGHPHTMPSGDARIEPYTLSGAR
jgi:hypothetical protein